MSRTQQPRAVAEDDLSLARDVEALARSLAVGAFTAVAGRAERVIAEAGRRGEGSLMRPAALLLAAAERGDAAGAVASLVRLAEAVDAARPPAARAA